MKNNDKASIVIITQAGSFQDGLKALLVAIHLSLDFRIAEGADAGKLLVKNIHPRLVMIDCAVFLEGGVEFLQHFKVENPDVKCLVFIETVHDSQVFQKIGSDGLLFKGFTNHELEHMIETLLKVPGESHLEY